ncbi:MAG: hypothetical protein AAF393_03240 [Pseudomonadota bacterium]
MNSFLFGAITFGIMTCGILLWVAVTSAGQLRAAWSRPRDLMLVNVGAVVTFTAFLISVQLIEPAVTYTVSSAMMPITAVALAGWATARSPGKRISLVLLALAIAILAYSTLSGQSGYVRGGPPMAALGLVLAMVDGIFFTLILVGSARLNDGGTGALAVLGLRMPLYVVVTAGLATATVTPAGIPGFSLLAAFVAAGLLLTVPPLYFLQRAVPILSTFALSSIIALGPLIIFGAQLLEGRVQLSLITFLGIAVYIVGSFLAARAAVAEQQS